MKRIQKATLATAVSLSMAMMTTGQAQSAGFALMEKNATDLGQAYANLATGNGEANGQVGNPAAMTQIDGTAVSGGINYIRPSFELKPGATSANVFGQTVGELGGDAGESAVIPNASIVHQLNERTRVGVALTVPFGLATEYNEGWLGRYHGIESHIEVIDISPSMSFDVTSEWTVGAVVNIQRAEAKLNSAIDGGSACVGGQIQQGAPADIAIGNCAALGLTPGTVSSDGHVEIEGDDWSVGYTIGALWQPSERTRVGLTYHSGIEHQLEGDVDYTMPAALAGSPTFADGPAKAGLDLPASVSAGLTHQFSDAVTGSLGLLWTGWSSFEELRVEQSGAGQDDLVTKENWDDTLRVAMGGEWDFAPRWTLRAGAAYDPTPVPSAEFRTARLPDSDRIWGSIGLGYAINRQWSVDLGYTHIWLNDSTINNETESGDRLQGRYESRVDIFGLQVNAHF